MVSKSRKKRSKYSILRVLLVYGLILLVAAVAGLRVLRDFLSAYETSRPDHVIRAYIDDLSDAEIDRLMEPTAELVAPQGRQPEADTQLLRQVVRGAELARQRGGDNRYVLVAEDRVIGQLQLRELGTGRFGFPRYTVDAADFSAAYKLREQSLTAPEGWRVEVNGTALGQDSVLETGIEYEELKGYYDRPGLTLPYQTRYTTGQYLTEPEIRLYDPSGAERTGTEEASWLDNCSPELKAEAEELVKNFISAYVDFTAHPRAAMARYEGLRPYMDKNSELADRLASAVRGMVYGSEKEVSIENFEILYIVDLGEQVFVDLHYTSVSSNDRGAVEMLECSKLLLKRSADGVLQVTEMERY